MPVWKSTCRTCLAEPTKRGSWSARIFWVRDGARETALELLRLERAQASAKDVAARIWWIGRVFDPDAVGGGEEMVRARSLLEGTHWEAALLAPDLVSG